MPKIEVEPKLERKLAEFSFNERRYTDSLLSMGISDGQLESLKVNFSKNTPKRLGAYSCLKNTIFVYPIRIEEESDKLLFNKPLWQNTSGTNTDSSLNYVIAHESKHAFDALQDWCIGETEAHLENRFELIQYATFGPTGLLIDIVKTARSTYREVSNLPSTAIQHMYGDAIEESAYKFDGSQEAVDLFRDIIHLEFK